MSMDGLAGVDPHAPSPGRGRHPSFVANLSASRFEVMPDEVPPQHAELHGGSPAESPWIRHRQVVEDVQDPGREALPRISPVAAGDSQVGFGETGDDRAVAPRDGRVAQGGRLVARGEPRVAPRPKSTSGSPRRPPERHAAPPRSARHGRARRRRLGGRTPRHSSGCRSRHRPLQLSTHLKSASPACTFLLDSFSHPVRVISGTRSEMPSEHSSAAAGCTTPTARPKSPRRGPFEPLTRAQAAQNQ